MPRCPKCQYVLVLLEKRRRYRCAKCGSLCLHKLIDDKEFGKWNKWQRKQDKETINPKKRIKLSEEEKKQRLREYQNSYRERNMEKIRAYDRIYNKKRWHSGIKKAYSKKLYHRDLEKSRLQNRIIYYRLRQKELALKLLGI